MQEKKEHFYISRKRNEKAWSWPSPAKKDFQGVHKGGGGAEVKKKEIRSSQGREKERGGERGCDRRPMGRKKFLQFWSQKTVPKKVDLLSLTAGGRRADFGST